MNLALRKSAIREALDAGQCASARQLIDDGLDSDPLNADLLAFCGIVYLRERRYADAAQSLASAVALGPQPAEVHYDLAFARYCDGRYADALDVLSTQVCLAAPLANVLRARCLHELERLDEAPLRQSA